MDNYDYIETTTADGETRHRATSEPEFEAVTLSGERRTTWPEALTVTEASPSGETLSVTEPSLMKFSTGLELAPGASEGEVAVNLGGSVTPMSVTGTVESGGTLVCGVTSVPPSGSLAPVGGVSFLTQSGGAVPSGVDLQWATVTESGVSVESTALAGDGSLLVDVSQGFGGVTSYLNTGELPENVALMVENTTGAAVEVTVSVLTAVSSGDSGDGGELSGDL